MHWYFTRIMGIPRAHQTKGIIAAGGEIAKAHFHQQWWLEQTVPEELEEARAEPMTLEEIMGGFQERAANLGRHQRHILEEALVSFDLEEALTIRDPAIFRLLGIPSGRGGKKLPAEHNNARSF